MITEIDTRSAIIDITEGQWPSEERIDIIGPNGNDGQHYAVHDASLKAFDLAAQQRRLAEFDSRELILEQHLAGVREARREYISRHNLNEEVKRG